MFIPCIQCPIKADNCIVIKSRGDITKGTVRNCVHARALFEISAALDMARTDISVQMSIKCIESLGNKYFSEDSKT